jgi:ABC-type transport system involved in Fe-S cluster assembly fused permease/ATPase subunit
LNLLNGAQSVILNIGLAALTVMAGFEVSGGHLRIGDVTTAIFLLSGLYAPLGMLGFQYREIRQAFIDMEQMVSLATSARTSSTRRTPSTCRRPAGRAPRSPSSTSASSTTRARLG